MQSDRLTHCFLSLAVCTTLVKEYEKRNKQNSTSRTIRRMIGQIQEYQLGIIT